ncbi:MAG TPA: DUF1998 domain-containing protein [Sphingomicrobium sp.]|nr:DUF1998 domain-containing protein [Sphingomicrobium sp.]
MSQSSAKSELRLSQVITTYGPGAMVDLPTRSVIIGGLDRWDMTIKGSWQPINEPRAVQLLEERLSQEDGPLQPGTRLSLRSPPVDPKLPGREPPGIAATVFPCWFIVNEDEHIQGGRRRRLVHWNHLDPSSGRNKFLSDSGKKVDVTPIRFVAACKKGHIQDIDWPWQLHRGAKCAEPLWLEEKGSTGDPRNIRIICGCGRDLSLQNAQAHGILGRCKGKQPWLDRDAGDGCTEILRFLTRSATNAYFPQVLTVISLPAAEDDLTRRVQDHWDKLRKVTDPSLLAALRMFDDVIAANFKDVPDDQLFGAIQRHEKSVLQSLDKKPKYAEFELLASGKELIGENRPDAKLHAETLSRDRWAGNDQRLANIASVVAVHRLREVSCLYGFTRFEAAPTAIDGDIEEINISVDGASLASELTWLPAIEQFGEGIFLTFDSSRIGKWLAEHGVQKREETLKRGFDKWVERRFQGRPRAPDFPRATYYMLHAFSHAVMAEVALECGYPTTALKERIYALPGEGGVDHYGLLLYTATAGAQGTLGGLLAIIPRLAEILLRSLDKLGICSSDPICSENSPENHRDDRAVHGAACHSCLLIPETSCEYRNLFLDRALVVPTLSASGCSFFL